MGRRHVSPATLLVPTPTRRRRRRRSAPAGEPEAAADERTPERIGILGGTFDPPHVGHLLAASDACEALSLDRLVFVPNAQQPLKRHAALAPAEARLEMVRLLCGSDPRFEADGSEVRRGGLSFTVDTLREYRARLPDSALFLLIGEDVVDTLPAWREIGAIRALAEIVVLARGVPEAGTPADGLRRLPTRRVDVSSTEVRARAGERRPLTGFVPPAVAAFIDEHRLYGAGSTAPPPRRNEP
jgi:nicotinate-nucleotide adenylyltransferase